MKRMFSKKQVVEALQNQDIECKELKEELDTELIDFSEYVSTGFAKSHNFYAKLQVKHNILVIVLSGSFVAGALASTNPTIVDNIITPVKNKINTIY